MPANDAYADSPMLAAEDLMFIRKDLQDRLRQGTGDFLPFAVVFAGPWSGSIFEHLAATKAYLDLRTGDDFHVYFAGLSQVSPPSEGFRVPDDRGRNRDAGGRFTTVRWNPGLFDRMRRDVAIESSQTDVGHVSSPWHFSGNSDLLLLRAMEGDGSLATIDWSSMLSLDLTRFDGDAGRPWFGQLVELIMRQIESDADDEQLDRWITEVLGSDQSVPNGLHHWLGSIGVGVATRAAAQVIGLG